MRTDPGTHVRDRIGPHSGPYELPLDRGTGRAFRLDSARMKASQRNAARFTLLTLVVFGVGIVPSGCKRDAHLAGRNIPENVQVHSVTHYGQTLDESATPEQVAFVLLRAIADDFEADSAEAREEALAVQFDLCAAGELAKSKLPSRLLDEHLYKIVYRWTPTISHYVPDFPKDWDSASKRLVRRRPSKSAAGVEECAVLLQVDDPHTLRDGKPDPNASVVIVIWMVKDGGYWRVMHPGFEQLDRPKELRRIRRADAGGAAPDAGSAAGQGN